MPNVDRASLLDTLTKLERLGANESGLLSFADGSQGGIFVECGRVCWVAARGLQRRLRDLLLAHSRLDSGQLERISERCRAEGLLLGQTLVAEGLLQPAELEAALRQHSAESLVDLCRSPQTTSWSAHVGRGYAPSFTFLAVDLLFDSMAVLYPTLQREATSELARYQGAGRRCVAFVLGGAHDGLVPLAQTGGSSIQAMLTLGRCLAPIPLASRELGTIPAFTLSTTAEGDTLLIWWKEALLFAVSCEDKASLVAATAQHLVCV